MDGKTLYAYFYYNTATEATWESVETVAPGAFTNSKLDTINLPNAITFGGYAFYSASTKNLSAPKVEQLATNSLAGNEFTVADFECVKVIGKYALLNCINLTTLVLGDKLEEVAALFISDCKLLKTITIKAVTPPKATAPLISSCNALTNIYVPEGSVEAYKAATGWSGSATKISAITEAVSVAPVEVAMLPEKKD